MAEPVSPGQDGMVAAEEIAFVIQHVLTAASTPKEARALAEEVSLLFSSLTLFAATGLVRRVRAV